MAKNNGKKRGNNTHNNGNPSQITPTLKEQNLCAPAKQKTTSALSQENLLSELFNAAAPPILNGPAKNGSKSEYDYTAALQALLADPRITKHEVNKAIKYAASYCRHTFPADKKPYAELIRTLVNDPRATTGSLAAALKWAIDHASLLNIPARCSYDPQQQAKRAKTEIANPKPPTLLEALLADKRMTLRTINTTIALLESNSPYPHSTSGLRPAPKQTDICREEGLRNLRQRAAALEAACPSHLVSGDQKAFQGPSI